ncbi:crystal protein-like [Branchiostoma floridae]|uniref:Carboxylic ester hydrolase n=1 Tax=Branchiostoma floridae TaxID=7739 RepID=A0A9J7N2T7_BRAFL|nr:crystal protein-like [Branchiostoma floridae]
MATATISQLLVFAALLSVEHAGALPPKPDGPIVHTRYGDVQGMYAEEGAIFLGLPFGVPPVGELRWKPPQAYNLSWAPDVRDGTVPGPACRQDGCGVNDTDYQYTCNRDKNRTQSEDCLYLNVYVPRSLLLNTTVSLPVMCWIHGGQYVGGTGAALVYDGRFWANKTNTVVVTTNYRLGAFGYLVTGEGEDDARGNYGTLDQIEALKWVQQNIADFGGDKDKVTVIGQSAGSDSIAVLLTSARAADLFHQGIMLSVPFSITHKTQFEAIRLGNDISKLVNCSDGDMKCLRSAPADDILHAQDEAGRYIADPFRLLEIFLQWGPTVDGDVLPRQTVDSFARGQFQKKPFIIGNVGEEAVLYVYSAFGKPMSKLELDAVALAFFRGKGPTVLREYNPPQTSDYRPFLSQAATDWVFVLADTMAYHYGNFAHTGDPNKSSPHVCIPNNVLKSPLNWPKYNEANHYPNINFTTPHNVIVHAYNKEKCDFWDKENIYSGTN